MNSGESLLVWSVRLTRRASADVQAGWQHMTNTSGEEVADAWLDGLETFLAKLATLPERYAVVQYASVLLGFPERCPVYRRVRGGPAYLIYFQLVENTLDAPVVRVIHVRHGAQEPLGKDEAEVISASLDD